MIFSPVFTFSALLRDIQVVVIVYDVVIGACLDAHTVAPAFTRIDDHNTVVALVDSLLLAHLEAWRLAAVLADAVLVGDQNFWNLVQHNRSVFSDESSEQKNTCPFIFLKFTLIIPIINM